jgi:hypothetical protein
MQLVEETAAKVAITTQLLPLFRKPLLLLRVGLELLLLDFRLILAYSWVAAAARVVRAHSEQKVAAAVLMVAASSFCERVPYQVPER